MSKTADRNFVRYIAFCLGVAVVSYAFGAETWVSNIDRKRYELYDKMAENRLNEIQDLGWCQALMNSLGWDLAGKDDDRALSYIKSYQEYEEVALIVGAALGFDRDSTLSKLKDGRELYDIWGEFPDFEQLCAGDLANRRSLLSAVGLPAAPTPRTGK